MTHFVVVALLPPRITNPRDKTAIEDALNAMLAPYSEHIDVEPYREYVQGERLQWYRDWLVEHGYGTDSASMTQHGEEWFGHPAGYDDELGELYYWNTYNPDTWSWRNVAGEEVGRTIRDEVLPGVRHIEGQRFGVLSHVEQEPGSPILVLQGVSPSQEQDEKQGSASEWSPPLDVWDNTGDIPGDVSQSERIVRYMPESPGYQHARRPYGRPLPQDREGSEAPVYEMQYSPRADGGIRRVDASYDYVLTKHLVGGSRWDWWVIGGRYSGVVQWSDSRFTDIGPVEQIDLPNPPSHIISADGEWHARGRNGWFGTFAEDADMTDEKWRAKFYEILSGHRTSLAVLLDCHI